MSDAGIWGQKLAQQKLGIRTAIPAAPGPQEAVVTKVGTAVIAMAGQTGTEMPVVWFSLPTTFGPAPGFGPAPYQPVHGWAPTVGTPCLVAFVGNGVGRPYVLMFPTATPS